MGYVLSEKDKANPDNEVLTGSPDFKVMPPSCIACCILLLDEQTRYTWWLTCALVVVGGVWWCCLLIVVLVSLMPVVGCGLTCGALRPTSNRRLLFFHVGVSSAIGCSRYILLQ